MQGQYQQPPPMYQQPPGMYGQQQPPMYQQGGMQVPQAQQVRADEKIEK
jgi:hypothetical protein